MSSFSHGMQFEVVTCYKCGMAFAMTAAYQKRRLDDHEEWFCPAGHGQFYLGKTEAQKLRDELARKDESLAREQARANDLRHQRDQITKAHRKMRTRVMNGVCPCCNRSFENLRAHMETQHADFGKEQTLKALRESFGMTQLAVAEEAGTRPFYVSLYERGKPVSSEARESLDWWIDSQRNRA